jgi:hypothetical protein
MLFLPPTICLECSGLKPVSAKLWGLEDRLDLTDQSCFSSGKREPENSRRFRYGAQWTKRQAGSLSYIAFRSVER